MNLNDEFPDAGKRAEALDYFEYEEIVESSPVDIKKEILENKKNYLCVFQPHGALSIVGIVSAVKASPEFQGELKLKPYNIRF